MAGLGYWRPRAVLFPSRLPFIGLGQNPPVAFPTLQRHRKSPHYSTSIEETLATMGFHRGKLKPLAAHFALGTKATSRIAWELWILDLEEEGRTNIFWPDYTPTGRQPILRHSSYPLWWRTGGHSACSWVTEWHRNEEWQLSFLSDCKLAMRTVEQLDASKAAPWSSKNPKCPPEPGGQLQGHILCLTKAMKRLTN